MDTVQFLQTLDLRNNYPMPGSVLILTWVGIIFVKILHLAGLYAYFIMGRHYICHYFTPSDSSARCKILTNIMPTHVKISIDPGIRELFRF
jgi:hypothetical protein